MNHRYQHHKGRNQRRNPNWHTQTQEEIYQENQRERLSELEASDRRQAEAQAEYDALPAEERARIEERATRLAAARWAEYLDHQAWLARKQAERDDPMSTFGT